MKTAKRIVIQIHYSKKLDEWHFMDESRLRRYRTKAIAVSNARAHCNYKWNFRKQPMQLVVHGKKGRIQFENTYGRDPQKYPG